MVEVFAGWDKAVAAAQKVLGDKGKIPKPKGALLKAGPDEEKAFQAFDKARNDLEAKIVALIDTTTSAENALDQFHDVIDEDDLGLNPKDKDDAKKIADAKKLLLDAIDDAGSRVKTNAKNERELNKHLANIKNYKQGA